MKITKLHEADEKTLNFIKKLIENFVPLIETLNGMMAIVLKEEKEKK